MFTTVVSALIMFAVHGFAFANIMYTHDGLVVTENTFTRIKLGRWAGYLYIRYFRGTFAAPWLVGMILSACVVMSVVMVTELLGFTGIKSVITALVMSANIAITAVIASFTKDVDVYGLALFFACAAVFASQRLPKVWNVIIPMIFICLSMGFYQVYMSCAAVLFILLIIKKIPDYTDKKATPLLKEGGLYVLILAGGFAVYFVMMKLMMAVFDAYPGGGYNSPSNLGKTGFIDILSAVPATYKNVWNYFFRTSGYNNRRIILLNAILLAVILVSSIIYIIRLKKKAFIYVIMLILLPVAANAVSLVSGEVLHTLMIYAIGLLYLLPVVLLDIVSDGKKAAKCGSIIVAAFLIFTGYHNFAYANGAYVYKQLVYDNTKEAVREIWRDVEAVEGYEPGDTRVNIMGKFGDADALRYKSSLADKYAGIAGMSSTAVTYDGLFEHMLRNILGKSKAAFSMNDDDIKENEIFIAMPEYPHEGYIQWIDDELVVKLSK